MAHRELVVSGCHGAVALEAIDTAFDGVALAVVGLVERRWPTAAVAELAAVGQLVDLARDGAVDPASAQVGAVLPGRVRPVGADAAGRVRGRPVADRGTRMRSRARRASAGAGALSMPSPDQPGETMPPRPRSRRGRSAGCVIPVPDGASTPGVADLQSSESHGPRDADRRPARAGTPRSLVAQVLPRSAQTLDVNDRVARHRDSGPAGSELQLDADDRMLDDRPGQIQAHPSVCGLDLEDPRYPPCASPLDPPAGGGDR